MLKGIDPLLNGALLRLLDDMGHADQLALVDRNYPAHAAGRPTIQLGEVTLERALRAILSVFPLDTFVPHPLERMEVNDDADVVAPVQARALAVAQEFHPAPLEFGVVPRLEFYERAKGAYAVVHTLEPAPYGCLILTKGVVFPDES